MQPDTLLLFLKGGEWAECGKAGKTHSQSPRGTKEADETKTSEEGGRNSLLLNFKVHFLLPKHDKFVYLELMCFFNFIA